MEHKRKVRAGNRGTHWFLFYSFWYLLIAFGIYLIFSFDGKTLIWANDGLRQVYNTMSYVSAHIRAFFETGSFTFDMMDFQIGQGMDTLACMCFYGLTDPINLLSAVTTGDGMEVLYAALIGLRVYLAGAAFGLYLRYTLRSDGWATTISAILYVFSCYLLHAAVRHPHFINGALYLPLLLYGVEKLMREKKPHALIGFTALMLITNFFFAYINTLLAILYIILRLAFRFSARRLRGTAADGFSLLGSYLLGLAISAVVFVPITYLYLQNGRADIEAGYTASLLYYPLNHYLQMFESIAQPVGASGFWAIVGFTPVSLFCATLLLLKRKKSRTEVQILIAIIALFVFTLIPIVGKAFNGFGYVTNRWSYALAFPMSAACAVMLPELATAPKKKLVALGGFWGVYVVFAVLFALYMNKLFFYAIGIAAIIACFAALVLIRALKVTNKLAFQAFVAVLVFAYAFCLYSPLAYDYADEFNDKGVYGRIMNDNLSALKLIDDDDVYRATETFINDPLSSLVGYMPVSYYWSIVPKWTADYQSSVMLSSRSAFHNVRGLDGRTTLCALAGLKYVVREKGSQALLPYGSFPTIETEKAVVYENPYALPFGYAFTQSVSEDALSALSPVDRELAYAQFAVLEDASVAGVTEGSFESALQELNWTLTPVSGVTLSDHEIVSNNNGRLRINFDAPAGSNLYLLIDGIVSKETNSTKATVLEFTCGSANGRGFLTNNQHPVSYQQTGLLLDLGCMNEARDGADLLIWAGARIKYDAIHVYAVPIENVTTPLAALATRSLTNVQTSPNHILGDITLDEPAFLQMSVQYGDGWTATVDGKATKVYRSGGMYMGIPLGAGQHTVAFTYRTPYILEGAIVTGAGLFIWIALAIWCRLRSARAAMKKSMYQPIT